MWTSKASVSIVSEGRFEIVLIKRTSVQQNVKQGVCAFNNFLRLQMGPLVLHGRVEILNPSRDTIFHCKNTASRDAASRNNEKKKKRKTTQTKKLRKRNESATVRTKEAISVR